MIASSSFVACSLLRVMNCPALAVLSCGDEVCAGDARGRWLILRDLPALRWFSAGGKAFGGIECVELSSKGNESVRAVDLPLLQEKCIKLDETSFTSLKEVLCEEECTLKTVLAKRCGR